MSDSPPPMQLVRAGLLTVALAWAPAAWFAFYDIGLALAGVADLGLLIGGLVVLTRFRPDLATHPVVRGGLVAAWALFTVFGLAWAASLVATSERLPLYDLLLLARPVWVFTADLYGGLAPWAAFGVVGLAALGMTGLAGLGFARLPNSETAPVVGGVAALSVVVGLVTTGLWTPRVAADMVASARLYGQVQSQIAAREDLRDRALVDRPDVRLYVIESYGDILLEPPVDEVHRPLLEELGASLTEQGWSIASGRALSPTHGGRSWLADATVLTGIEVDRQATFGHVTARGRTIPSMPSFFAERGYATVLVRPKDRARPGVVLVNHFGFATTVFHDALAYTGPAVGWGHIPDQYTVDVTERTVIDGLKPPVFAFFHLATAHYPWGDPPEVLDDARAWQTAKGDRDLIQRDRKPWFALGMELARYKSERRPLKDKYGADLANFQALVAYDLEVLARAFPAPERPTLMVWYGDHQPPFLADGETADTVLHVLASDPRWLRPFLAEGFLPGMDPGPRGATTLHHRDLFDRITTALGDPARRDARPAD